MGSIKEQVYLEKLNQLNGQLQMLLAGTHVDYVRSVEQLKKDHDSSLFYNNLCRQLEVDRIERDCDNEKTAALRDFEEKRGELRESLISELEERRKQIEHEYQTMELTSDSIEVKPMKTRNLRRRFNDPTPANDAKRSRKASPTLKMMLPEAEINDDLKAIAVPTGGETSTNASQAGRRESPNNCDGPTGNAASSSSLSDTGRVLATDDASTVVDVSIDGGKLIYQKKCYTRGQPVYVDTTDSGRVAAVVQTIGAKELTLRMGTGKRVHVTLAQLQQGKYILWRRPS